VLPHPHLEPLRMTSAIPEAPPNLKLLLIGNSSVGKSSLLTRFTDASFTPEDESSATIGVDFRVCKMEVKGKRVKLSIWDTAGQERFRTITSSYYRGAQGIILVYDIANRETFDALPRWYTELEQYVSPHIVKILVGNKLDKEFSRTVSEEEGRKFAERTGSLFIEASAKTAVNVREAFIELVEKILDNPSLYAPIGSQTRTVTTANNRTNRTMPGAINLSASDDDHQSSGCSC